MTLNPQGVLSSLVEAKALRLGAKIKCPVCTRHNWFQLDALDYSVECRFCLSDFTPPLSSPKSMPWTYRSHGPFAASVAQGAFTVLLTLYFLSNPTATAVTPLFSFSARKGDSEIEADLSCLYRSSSWRNHEYRLVHAECKSFNTVESKDISRMRLLRDEFPGSTLVFSFLKDALADEELKLISAFVMTERRKRLRGEVYSPIVILTGTELFSADEAPRCWRGKGEPYDGCVNSPADHAQLDVLADSTQRIHLLLPPWREWADSMTNRNSRKE